MILKEAHITHRDDIAVCYDEHKLTGCNSRQFVEVLKYTPYSDLVDDSWVRCRKCGRNI
jgi:hypothetical protein